MGEDDLISEAKLDRADIERMCIEADKKPLKLKLGPYEGCSRLIILHSCTYTIQYRSCTKYSCTCMDDNNRKEKKWGIGELCILFNDSRNVGAAQRRTALMSSYRRLLTLVLSPFSLLFCPF